MGNGLLAWLPKEGGGRGLFLGVGEIEESIG